MPKYLVTVSRVYEQTFDFEVDIRDGTFEYHIEDLALEKAHRLEWNEIVLGTVRYNIDSVKEI